MNYEEILNIMKRHSELLTKIARSFMTDNEKQEFQTLCNKLNEVEN